jgi:hypothetical protein
MVFPVSGGAWDWRTADGSPKKLSNARKASQESYYLPGFDENTDDDTWVRFLPLAGKHFLAMVAKPTYVQGTWISGQLVWFDRDGALIKTIPIRAAMSPDSRNKLRRSDTFPAVATPDGGVIVGGLFGGLHRFDRNGRQKEGSEQGEMPSQLWLLPNGSTVSLLGKMLQWQDEAGHVFQQSEVAEKSWDALASFPNSQVVAVARQRKYDELHWFNANGRSILKKKLIGHVAGLATTEDGGTVIGESGRVHHFHLNHGDNE